MESNKSNFVNKLEGLKDDFNELEEAIGFQIENTKPQNVTLKKDDEIDQKEKSELVNQNKTNKLVKEGVSKDESPTTAIKKLCKDEVNHEDVRALEERFMYEHDNKMNEVAELETEMVKNTKKLLGTHKKRVKNDNICVDDNWMTFQNDKIIAYEAQPEAKIPDLYIAFPLQNHYNLIHYQQRFNWDCGISCIIMILSTTQRQEFLQNFDQICIEEGFGTSTWTIDLCYLLRRFQINHEYYTKTLGIDPNYNQSSYYSKVINVDEKRVNHKFKVAKSHGLHIEQRMLKMETLVHHLAKHGPIILLTNGSLLTCEICKKHVLEKFGCFRFSWIAANIRTPKSYAGHYVVLCGYDLKLERLYYRNPEVQDEHICQCSMDAMDVARKAYGTDEDVVLIFQH